MRKPIRIFTGLAVLMALVVVLTAGPAAAKKPPPGDGGLTNPALTFDTWAGKLYLMTADGAESDTLAGGKKTPASHGTWLPDGSGVAFLMNGGLYTVRIDGGGLTYIRSFDREFTFLTDRIILYRRAGDVEIMDLVTGDTQSLGVLNTLPSAQKVITPTATPDLDANTAGYQGWIAYSNNNWETVDPWPEVNPDIHIVKLTGSTVGGFAIDTTTITRLELDTPQKHPEWSADGKTIAYHHRANYLYEGLDLAVVGVTLGDSPGFGAPSVIHTPEGGTVGGRPAVSPDGRWISFAHRIYGGKSEVELIRSDGQGWKVLTTRINLPWGPHWNPAWENDLD